MFVRDFSSVKVKWIPGTIFKVTGSLSYHVQVSTGVVRCHVDNIHCRSSEDSVEADLSEESLTKWPNFSLPAEEVSVPVPAHSESGSHDAPSKSFLSSSGDASPVGTSKSSIVLLSVLFPDSTLRTNYLRTFRDILLFIFIDLQIIIEVRGITYIYSH